MKRSRTYRSQNVQSVAVAKLLWGHEGQAAVVGVDVGNEALCMTVRWSSGQSERPIRVAQPAQLRQGVALLTAPGQGRSLKVAVEPTGTYGDPWRYACQQAGLAVERVSPVASNRHAEVYDGASSQHDGKDAGVVAELCYLGKSKPWAWEAGTVQARELAVPAELMDAYQEEHNTWRSRLEAKLARYWPEVPQWLALDSVTLLELLLHYGSPAALAADAQAAARLAQWGGRFLTAEKIAGVVAAARQTVGVPVGPAEAYGLKAIAQRALDSQRRLAQQHQAVTRKSAGRPEAALLGPALGRATVAILHVENGDPAAYGGVRMYPRALGLNLVERSSGHYVGRLHISRRGSARSRRWLYLAALRLVQEPGIKHWYQAKVARDGGQKGNALTAVMRKLAAGMHHCVRTGEAFDPARVFPAPGAPAGRKRGGAAAGGASPETRAATEGVTL